MFWNKKSDKEDERLDRIGRQLLKAHALSEREADAATSPQLYAKLRARIAAQSSLPAGAPAFWPRALRVAAVITIFLLGTLTGVMINSYYRAGDENITRSEVAPHDTTLI